jgi:hypothetical protein
MRGLIQKLVDNYSEDGELLIWLNNMNLKPGCFYGGEWAIRRRERHSYPSYQRENSY